MHCHRNSRLEALGLAGIRTSGTGVGGGEGQPGLFGAPVVGVAFSWDGDVIAEEAPLRLDGSIDWNKAKRWHYEPNSFRPLAKEAPDGTLFYIVTDHLGTPREMFEESGKLRWAAEYRTWGEMRRLWVAGVANDNAPEVDDPWADVLAPLERPTRSSSGGNGEVDSRCGGRIYGALALKSEVESIVEARFLCPIRFQGQWEDEESGLYYNRFRYYDPLAGQYISRDPIGLGGGIQPSAYVHQPNVMIDPYGLVSCHDVVPYRPSSSPLENHHGVLDVWAAANIPGYASRAASSPTIALTAVQHAATKAVYRDWLTENFGRPVGAQVDWTKVSPQEAQSLAERMFDAAKVPADARKNYFNALHSYIYSCKCGCTP
ncbi:RHS repeat-associated core domain-containing protein [Labrys sp. La1]|uniref:RHS repeat-associated core domain-containing protein n=1 Tax=Labrys sp. La1 TaxID=3404917 RepID=UPI003EBFF85D